MSLMEDATRKRKTFSVELASDEESPSSAHQPRRRPGARRARSTLAQLRAELISEKTRRLIQQGRSPWHPTTSSTSQPHSPHTEEENEGVDAVESSASLSSASTAQGDRREAEEEVADAPAAAPQRHFQARYRLKDSQRGQWKPGYLVFHHSPHLTTLHLLSASRQLLQDVDVPASRCLAPTSSDCLDCDPYTVEVMHELSVDDVAAAQLEREEKQSERKRMRPLTSSLDGSPAVADDLKRGIVRVRDVSEEEKTRWDWSL